MSSSHKRGFTLIETLVVLAVSVLLVTLMTGLYRTIGKAYLALGDDSSEWQLQTLLRDQLRNGHVTARRRQFILGDNNELLIATWLGRINGRDGPPVLAHYRFDSARRGITYQETDLPAWWEIDGDPENLSLLRQRYAAGDDSRLLVNGVETLEISYIPPRKGVERHIEIRTQWAENSSPTAVRFTYDRAGKTTAFWLEAKAYGG